MGSLLASEWANAGAAFASKRVSHSVSTEPLWEACLQANGPTPGRDSPASWSPTAFLQSLCGKLACKRTFQRGRGAGFASKRVSRSVSTEPLWEACLQANVPTPGRDSPASWSPTAFLQSRCGKLACKRTCQRRGGSPASWSPTAFLRSRCGKLACKRTRQRRGAFASKRVSHSVSTEPLWEACLQANGPTPGRHSPASGSPTAFLRSRCGRLACKRMGQRRSARIRQQAGLPQRFYRAAVGSLLASERANAEGAIRAAPLTPTKTPAPTVPLLPRWRLPVVAH